MSRRKELGERWSFRLDPIEKITEAISRESWDASAGWWAARSGAKGDVNREWVIDPALFRIVGEVRGRRVLDAGCGTGYLARLLAARGASVVAADHSRKLLEIARAEEEREPRGLTFVHADLGHLDPLPDRTFDLVVSNVVMQDVVAFGAAFREFRRVLQPRGRLVFSVTHPCFERPVPGRSVREPPDSERFEDWRGLLLDRYYDRVALWWGPIGQEAMVGFHRTLEDYAEALRSAGFAISRIVEPTPRPEALRRMYRQFADYLRVPNFLIVEAVPTPARARGFPRGVHP
jgi:SAM-dependent methyltransferase